MWWIILGLLALIIAVLLIRAAMFRPRAVAPVEADEVDVNAQKAFENLASMIRARTVSYLDASAIDYGEFERFKKLLHDLYPNFHSRFKPKEVGTTGLLYKWPGKRSESPVVFMAHYDVVPADEAAWEKPPFDGVMESGVLWGRGTLDTKCTLCAVMECAEELVKSGFVPENDIYFAFSGDEEIMGESAPMIVDELQKMGVKPQLVLDEGGAVVQNVFPGVKAACAMVGIAEKGLLNIVLSAKTAGGHASAPPAHTPVGMLSGAVCDIERRPFKRRLTTPVRYMFDILGRHSSFGFRLIFANLWCFLPLLDMLCRKKGGELNALMRTTCAFTMMEGSQVFNVLPTTAKVGANLRLYDTVDETVKQLKATANNPEISLDVLYGIDPSIVSEVDCAAYKAIEAAILKTWPDVLVSPYMMLACSDSRHYGSISDKVYRFSGMELSGEERKAIHGNNERISIDKFAKTLEFYMRLMRAC